MGEVKISFEATSIKEVLDDFTAALEEMGTVVIKPHDDIPESLEEVLKSKGIFLFRPGEKMPEGLLHSILEEHQEDLIDLLLGNEDATQRLMERMEEVYQKKNCTLFKPGEGIPEGLLQNLLEEDQEELFDFLLENKETLQRIRECLEERGYKTQQSEKKDSWD